MDRVRIQDLTNAQRTKNFRDMNEIVIECLDIFHGEILKRGQDSCEREASFYSVEISNSLSCDIIQAKTPNQEAKHF
jgi:hypothetical protein